MNEDLTPEQIKERALEADRLRLEPAFQRAVLQLRKDAVDALIAVNPNDPNAILKHQAEIRAIDGLATSIANEIQRGTVRTRAPVA